MKRAILCLVLLNFIFTLACVKVHVEILQQGTEAEKRTPDPGKHIDPRELPEMEPVKTGIRPTCPTDGRDTPSVAQDTGVWCWAASAKAIMSFHKVDIDQCHIVNKVNETRAGEISDGGGTPFCCASSNVETAQCQQNGWPEEAFDEFGFDYGWSEGALSPKQIVAQTCQNGPFSYIIRYDGGGGHTSVVKAYQIDDDKEMSLLVHQHEYYTDGTGHRYAAPFKVKPYSYYQEGWFQNRQNTVEYNLIQISPRQ